MTFRPMYRPYSNPDTRSSVLAALRDGADAAAARDMDGGRA